MGGYPSVSKVLVIGCGGTGAYTISHLSRLISVINGTNAKERGSRIYKNRPDVNLYLADGDLVEAKNLNRQHFISQEVGRNKAEVLGERYSAAFGLQIGVIPKDIEKVGDLDFFMGDGNSATLIIGCVDNNASRRVIMDWFYGTKDGSPDNVIYKNNYASKFWIDSGNEERNGQVICGYIPAIRGLWGTPKMNPHKAKRGGSHGEFSLPCVTEVYKNISEQNDRFNSQMSCAERAESAPQNMQTNVTAATIIMNYATKILMSEIIKSHGVEFNIDNAFSTKLNTPENLSIIKKSRLRFWEK